LTNKAPKECVKGTKKAYNQGLAKCQSKYTEEAKNACKEEVEAEFAIQEPLCAALPFTAGAELPLF